MYYLNVFMELWQGDEIELNLNYLFTCRSPLKFCVSILRAVDGGLRQLQATTTLNINTKTGKEASLSWHSMIRLLQDIT